MALVWEKQMGATCYQVRSAGASLRLYTDGIFHSQWNPRTPVMGNLWDLLFIPAFFRENANSIKKALVLGVGGGAVINQLNHFLNIEEISGVDLDKVHLQIAKRHFGAKHRNTVFHHADAYAWLADCRGVKFDIIIEDLFKPSDSDPKEPVRAISASQDWMSLLASRLSKNGILVMNYETVKQCRTSQASHFAKASGLFENGLILTTEKYENAIAVYLKRDGSRSVSIKAPLRTKIAEFYKRLQRFPELDLSKTRCRLCVKLSKLF